MSTITTINASDTITSSRTVINTNFSNLNTDKMETSVLDTDTSLVANSDLKVATQKAVKAYVDAGGNVNASTTTRGIVEEATQAEFNAGTAVGGTGARLFVNPSVIGANVQTLVDSSKYAIGALSNTLVKTYYNFQLLFILWTGSVANDTTTTFGNWFRSDGTDVVLSLAWVDFQSVGTAVLTSDYLLMISSAVPLQWASTNNVIMDFWAKLTSGTGDVFMGLVDNISAPSSVYTSTVYNKIGFSQNAGGTLYATSAKAAVGVTNTSVSSGITLTNWNNYRIELDPSNNALFYINGVLKATIATNAPSAIANIFAGFGRSDTALFTITAPNFSIQMV